MRRTFHHFLILALLLQSLAAFGQTDTSLDASFSKGASLTDAQAKEAKEFVHQGLQDKNIKEGCEKNGLGECSQNDVEKQGAVFNENLDVMIPKMYGLLMGAMTMAGGNNVTVVDKKAATSKEVTKAIKHGTKAEKEGKTEKTSDYCVYVATAYELIGAQLQQSLNSKITAEASSLTDQQLKALVSLKEAHLARKKTANFQAGIYGATSACYIARLIASQGRVVADWKYWSKMGAAAALSGLFVKKANKHKKNAEKVQLVIDSLPKDGKCNAWTDTKCFCAEASSKELYAEQYQNVCVLNKGDINTPIVATGCGVLTNGVMAYDAKCQCKETNTCFKGQLLAKDIQFSQGLNFMSQANKGYDLISAGEFDSGKLDQYSLSTGANAAKVAAQIKPKDVPQVNLTDDEKKLASSLSSVVPPALAAIAAQSPDGNPPSGGLMNDGTKAALDKVAATASSNSVKELVKYSSGGPGFGSVNNEVEAGFAMPSAAQDKAQDSGPEILSFAEKAIMKAEISNAPETPIFDIISNRYKRSGWTKLQAAEVK